MNGFFSFFGVLSSICLLCLVVACQDNSTDKTARPGVAASGVAIFKKNCVTCHGADGKLGLNGAKDLTQSMLTVEERIPIITKGKNLMTPFEKMLTPEEIQAVAQYTTTLRTQQ
jgi:cytochrome c6